MVCSKCEKKLATPTTGDTKKDGAGPSRKINENKLLSKSKFSPYTNVCKVCKMQVHQKGGHYCQQCAYKRGICSMCGVKILDTKFYKQSSK